MHACQYVHVLFDRWIYVYLSMQPDLISPLSDHGVTRPPQTVRGRVRGIVCSRRPFRLLGQWLCLIIVLDLHRKRFHLYDWCVSNFRTLKKSIKTIWWGPFLMWLASVGTNDEKAETQPQWSIELLAILNA